MKRYRSMIVAIVVTTVAEGAMSQVVMTGRLTHPRWGGEAEGTAMSAVHVFGNTAGSEQEPTAFRTWETHPVGWYRLSGAAGRYTLLFTTPGHFMRPLVVCNQFVEDGATVDRNLSPRFTMALMSDAAWDTKAAHEYFQPFTATGDGVTHVGFRLAHDGVDGGGPGNQNLLVSIHRVTGDDPSQWPAVSPTMPVMEVDSGGAKNYIWSAGFNSGEALTKRGERYAVRIAAEQAGGSFQPFWRASEDGGRGCYRRGAAGENGFTGHDLWMTIAGDGDGLLIPYNKRVHRSFNDLTHCIGRWTQTYVAQGRGLAGVVVYAAVSGAQPPLSRQRLAVRILRDGPGGEQVGATKLAIGDGNYTGDASWGVFGAVYEPGEVTLEPGRMYAIDMTSIENHATIAGFVNIKGQVSDGKAGFNPYRRHAREADQPGTAYQHGDRQMDFDLDMQVIEYQHAAAGWAEAMHEANLLIDGDMESNKATDATERADALPGAWKPYARTPHTQHQWMLDPPSNTNRILRITGENIADKPIDGGFVQRVAGLRRTETYRLSARIRASWPLSDRHQTRIGIDPTGQIDDPSAATIRWVKLPPRHGHFIEYHGEPIRPTDDAVSVWLHATTTGTKQVLPFTADFDDVKLRQVLTDAPLRPSAASGPDAP